MCICTHDTYWRTDIVYSSHIQPLLPTKLSANISIQPADLSQLYVSWLVNVMVETYPDCHPKRLLHVVQNQYSSSVVVVILVVAYFGNIISGWQDISVIVIYLLTEHFTMIEGYGLTSWINCCMNESLLRRHSVPMLHVILLLWLLLYFRPILGSCMPPHPLREPLCLVSTSKRSQCLRFQKVNTDLVLRATV